MPRFGPCTHRRRFPLTTQGIPMFLTAMLPGRPFSDGFLPVVGGGSADELDLRGQCKPSLSSRWTGVDSRGNRPSLEDLPAGVTAVGGQSRPIRMRRPSG